MVCMGVVFTGFPGRYGGGPIYFLTAAGKKDIMIRIKVRKTGHGGVSPEKENGEEEVG